MILWTIRIAGILYVIAIAQMIRRRPARVYWIVGCAFYLAHVAAAFHYAYHWSHAVAVQETARQTEALFGLNWGGGIWFNYAFTAIWTADAFWWLIAPGSRQSRPAWIDTAVHSFMAWMFVNGAIVFPRGPARWIAAGLAAALLLVWRRSR
jgi:hypothetical protein